MLAACLLGAGAGCVTTPTPPVAPGMVPVDSHKVTQGGKRKPSADLLVACGQYAESTAQQPQIAPKEREALQDKARKVYQQALQLDPEHKGAHDALASVYTDLGEHERALAVYDKAVKKYPKEMKFWCAKGECHCRKKDWAVALECFRKALEIDPEDRQCLTELGLCLARAGKIDESVAYLTKAHGAAQAHFDVARMLRHLKRDEECKRHLLLAVQANPELKSATEMLAQLEAPPPDANRAIVTVGFQATAPGASKLPPPTAN